MAYDRLNPSMDTGSIDSAPGTGPIPETGLRPLTRVVVDLSAIADNVRALQSLCGEETAYMAVVKADAYGHGAVRVAKTALAAGSDFLGVARISEAVQLRDAGITAPVLLFGDILPDQAVYAASRDIRVTFFDADTAAAASRAVRSAGLTLKAHIKVDTGMGRLGLTPGVDMAAAIRDIAAITAMEGIDIEGVYTHFANADSPDTRHALEQVALFSKVKTALAAENIAPPIFHAANSAAAMTLPRSRFDMIRPGIAMYGLPPSPDTRGIVLRPALSIRSAVIQIKQVPKGFPVSYGSTYVTDKPTRIATVPIGYADGYSRLLSSRAHMLVNGQRAPVAGRVCMDFTMIDVGHIPGVRTGDDVVVLGSQGTETVSADELANHIQTINYEVVAGLTGRIPTRYIKDPHD